MCNLLYQVMRMKITNVSNSDDDEVVALLSGHASLDASGGK